jgi:PPOX class probable FMN-dependent enzyme
VNAGRFADPMVTSIEALEKLYKAPSTGALIKEIDHVNAHYRAFIEAAPFVVLATCGPDGLDCSPRGDAPGFVRVRDEKTLLIPDRPGNNRVDSLRNLICNPRIALLFLIPGIGETLRVIGRAAISVDQELMQSFAMNSKVPRSLLMVSVQTVYFQCSKAIVRSRLWDAETKIDRARLPSTGTILASISDGKFGGESYDRELPERIRRRLY